MSHIPLTFAKFKAAAAPFVKNLFLEDLNVAFLGPLYRPCFIDLAAISSDALIFAFGTLVRQRRIEFL
jgi:hypothetical protein